MNLSGDVIELLIYHQPSVKPSLTLRPFGVLGYVAGHSLTELSSHSQTHQSSKQSKASDTTMNMSSKEFNVAWEAHIKTKPWS